MALEWKSELSVSDPVIDLQHMELLERSQKLLDAINSGQNTEYIDELREYLSAYVFFHRYEEERWMAAHRYPDIEAHKKSHDELVRSVQRLNSLADNTNSYELAVEVLRVIARWKSGHIEKMDVPAGRYISENNGQLVLTRQIA